jgi:hypothetical protein
MSTFSVKKWAAILDAIEWFRAFCRKSDEASIRRLPEIEQDARRYRWLRSNNDPGPDVVRCVTLDQTTEPVDSRMCFGDDLDAQIDAEMVGHVAAE